ncbi:MAG: sortase [Candidatus Peregrinibacteria bacterium]|nr:sortase [Candidatus Peregrinibacteria bacterium]MCB9808579.1 sortase [Candidatus Peribacteria bacterium]
MYQHPDWHEENDHKAHVDESGHIFIGDEQIAPRIERSKPIVKKSMNWEVLEEDEVVQEARSTGSSSLCCDQVVNVLKGVRSGVMATTKEFAVEGCNQYAYSYKHLHNNARIGLQNLWAFLVQPVWIARKNKPVKEYSRGTLFLLDTVRFGGTFATIFVVLFVSLNFQSFWQIVTPYLDPVERVSSLNGSASDIDAALRDKLLKSPMLATAGREEGDMLSYLPEVGPPENRVIIPKINLNIPLVTPSYSSLLREDWAGVESDIQEALERGVVHYPGTARPGQAGNFFVTGHSSYYPWAGGHYKTVFARLHELTVGDEYWVYYGGDKHRYVVTGKKEVKPSDVTVLDQPNNKRTGTLMTCTPVGTTLRRLIISSQEIDPVSGLALDVGQHETRESTGPNPGALPI